MSAAVDAMVGKAQSDGAPIVAIEVRHASGSYERALGRSPAVVALHAILAAPSHDDGRYRIVDLGQLAGETPAQVAAALTAARAIAARVGVGLAPEDGTITAKDAPRWVARQGPPPERAWTIEWTRTTWRDDGTTIEARGTSTVTATGSGRAHYLAVQEALRDQRSPITIAIAPFDGNAGGAQRHGVPFPIATGDPWALRGAVRDGVALSVVLGALRAQATPLELMVAIEDTFGLTLEAVAPVGAFGRGELDGAALDAAIAPMIADRRAHWLLPLTLRETHAAGRPIGPALRAAYPEVGNAIALMRAMIDVFDLTLVDAKDLVSEACDGRHDAAIDRALATRAGSRGRFAR